MTLEKRPHALIFASFLVLPPRSGEAPERLRFTRLRSAGPDREGLVHRSGQRQDASRRRGWIESCALELVARRPLVQIPPRLHTPAAVERPLHPCRRRQARLRCGPTRQPARPAWRHDQADERQLRRHRHRRLLAAGRQPEFRHSRGRARPDAGVLDPVHPLDQKWVFKGIKVQSLFGTNNNKQGARHRLGPGTLASNLRHHPAEHADQHG